MNWQPYDPEWLIDLARAQRPQRTDIIEALRRCTRADHESPAYAHFVDPRRANKPGAEWQFAENISLEDPVEGHIVLDVLRDGSIGGVEIVSRIQLTE